MFDRLLQMSERFDELEQIMVQPEIASNYSLLQSLIKEKKDLEPLVLKYRSYLSLQKQLNDAEELLHDPLLAAEAENEISSVRPRLSSLRDELELLLIPEDPLDSRNVILEIRAGVGGEEAALFACDILRMYRKYCDRSGLSVSITSLNDTDLGGVSDASLLISGPESYARLKFESGVHCVKRVPVTESSGRIHTSTVTVAVLPEAEETELVLSPADIRTDVFHASGHGGQGVNTTDSAVRLTYLPTGLTVICQDERSQLENKAKALRVLRSRLFAEKREKEEAARASDRKEQIGSGERSDRIRTYYFNHDYVVDHRLALTVSRTANILDGDLDPFIKALRLAEKTCRLKSLHD